MRGTERVARGDLEHQVAPGGSDEIGQLASFNETRSERVEMKDALGFVRRHEACWEIAPHFELLDGRFRHVGFDLVLHARIAGTDPGAAGVAEVHETLRDIVLPLLPPDAHWQVEPFDASVHLRPETDWAPEVELRVGIRYGDGTFDLASPFEVKRVRAIGSALARLGLQEGVYRRIRAAA